jgi:hypothetical protein
VLGPADGDLVGLADGVVVGEMLGPIVGFFDGLFVGDEVEQGVIRTGTCNLPQVFPRVKDAMYLSDASRRDTVANDSRHKHLVVSSFGQFLF